MSRTYRDAGVDQEAADALIPFFAEQAVRTKSLEVTGDVGGFAAGFSLGAIADRDWTDPVLIVSTDGVGTKVELLRASGRHRTAGWDAVAMNVDDVVCVGAEPLFVVDYVSIERLDDGVMREIVGGVADACVEAGCALVGGETSQHPGLLPPDGYDVVATCVGAVDAGAAWGAHRVRTGDAVVGTAATGPHANGFSLVRRLVAEGTEPPDVFLAPTAIHCRAILRASQTAEVHAAAHVTGGGIVGNLRRALPEPLGAVVELSAWPRPGWCDWLSDAGVDDDELYSTFNGGIGMLLVVPDGPGTVAALEAQGTESWVVGEVTASPGVALR